MQFKKQASNLTFIIIVLLLTGVLSLAGYHYFASRNNGEIETSELDFSDKKSGGLFSPLFSDIFSSLDFFYSSKDDEGEEKNKNEEEKNETIPYAVHKDITSTVFWIGEKASDDNKEISNSPSAWDESWKSHFGGTDDPKKRNGYFPEKFTPRENPFYVALPYNDFNSDGERKNDIFRLAPWANGRNWKDSESACKNQWVKIIKGGKIAYAQWEDVGPFKENDAAYVFGNARPKSKTNKNAGIDVSPAVKDFLSLKDIDKVDWQFIDASDVPDGPWKKIITTSQIYWK